MFTHPLAVDMNTTTKALTSMLYQSWLEPPVFAADGSLNPEDWLQSVNVYRTSLDLTDAQILFELPHFLSKEPSDNQERILRGILDRMQMPDEPLPTFVAHMLGEFRKLKSSPPQQEQIDLIRKHVLEKYRVALYGTPIPSVMELLLRAHELHAVLGPSVGCLPPRQASSVLSREVHCFKCSLPGFTSRTCPNCSLNARPRLLSTEPPRLQEDAVSRVLEEGRTDGSNRPIGNGTVVSDFTQRGNFRGGRTFRRGNPPSRK